MRLILTVLVVLVLLVNSELWWRLKKPHDEFSRKFIHITVGTFAAFWPYFLTWNEIILLSIAFVAAVVFSRYFGVFRAIHAVERPTWGEVCFAVAVGTLAVTTREPLIYMAALLHMGLADGIAALVGTAYGKKNSYRVWGQRKSIAGSMAFFLVSLIILIGYGTISPVMLHPAVLVAVAGAATALENLAVKGLDNLVVPLMVAGVLTAIS